MEFSGNKEGGIEKSWIFLVLVIIFAALLRAHLLDIPFERDEGEYAYMGSLILRGIPPYLGAYNMKLPGIFAAYAVVMGLLGESIRAVHAGLLLVNALTAVFVYLVARRFFGALTGTVAGALFSVASLTRAVQGLSANAEHFVIFFATAGLLFLLRAMDSEKKMHIFLSGLFLGTGFLMKQHGVFFIIFAVLYLLWVLVTEKGRGPKKAAAAGAVFLSAAALPFAATCLVLYISGAFDRFWFWTFTYAGRYAAQVGTETGLVNLRENFGELFIYTMPLWFFFAAGLFLALWKRRAGKGAVFVYGFLIFSFMAVTPGLYFRKHYFNMILPVSSIFAALGLTGISGMFSRLYVARIYKSATALLLTALCIGLILYRDRRIFFDYTPREVSREIYGANPFPESVDVAGYIRGRSSPGDYIAVLGSEPQIYFYVARPAASRYIYMYPLTEGTPYTPQMQREFINDIMQRKPLYIVYVGIATSWFSWTGKGAAAGPFIARLDDYLSGFYKKEGVIDIFADGTDYFWGRDAMGRRPVSRDTIMVFRRKSGL